MEICLVGGAVRDQLLGLEVKDRDWVVIGATPEEMRQQGYRPVGKDFPVFINPETGEEFALARTERKSGHGYQGFTFHTDPSVTLEEDLLRRDLTINAMAIRSDGTLVDPYHGQQDITHRILRHISPAFAEDPLRVLRVARFAARFTPLGFSIAPETLSLMQQISDSGELTHLSAERIWSEFERALQGEHPLVFLTCLQQANALESTLAEFKQLNWAFAAIAMKRLNSLHPSAEQRFALLCYLALEDMPEKNALKNFCTRLRAPKRFQQAAGDLIEWGKVAASFNKQSSSRRLEMVKEMKLLRQPERLTCLLPTSMALHPDMQDHLTEPLWAMLEQLRQVTATQWIEKGLQGRAVGEAMEQEYLRIISRF